MWYDTKVSLIKRFESVPKPWIALTSLAIILAVGFLDSLTHREVSVALLYVLPISIATWYLGKRAGILTAIASELVWVLADSVMAHEYRSPGIIYWNAAMRLGVFLTYSITLSGFKTMLDRLEEERTRSQRLAAQIIRAQEQERQRIARELHDEASQVLTGLTLRIEQMKVLSQQSGTIHSEDFDHLKTLATQISAEIRRLAFNLRPAMLEDLGLAQSLSTLFRDQLRKRGVRAFFTTEEQGLRLPSEVELTLFRITQEAVANIVKYSHATEVTAKLSREGNHLNLEIRDNGIGFDPQSLQLNKSQHLGISGMEERASLLEGKLDLTSSPGNGTRISLSVPWKPIA